MFCCLLFTIRKIKPKCWIWCFQTTVTDLSLDCHSPLISGLQQILQALAVCQRQHRVQHWNRSGIALRANFKLNLPRVERAAVFPLFLMPVLWVFLEASTCTSCMYSYKFTTLSAPSALPFCFSVPPSQSFWMLFKHSLKAPALPLDCQCPL